MSYKYIVAVLLPFSAFVNGNTSSTSEQVQAEQTNLSYLDTLVVTASRFEKPLADVIAPVNVVTREEIEQSQAKSMTEVLRQLPGIEVSVQGGVGQLASVFIRGTNSTHALVLVDGIRMNQSLSSGTNINRIPLSQVERIELIRGSGAAIYGSDAIGGVLNIITRSEFGSKNTNLSVGVGSNKYREANFVATTDVTKNSHIKVAAGFQQTEGFNVNPIALENEDDKHGFDGSQLLINYEYRLNEISLLAGVRWFDNHAQYNRYNSFQGSTGKKYLVANGQSENQVYTLQTNYQKQGLKSSFTVSHQSAVNTDSMSSVNEPFSLLDIDMTTVQWANYFNLDSDFSFLGGIDWRSEKVNENSRNISFDVSWSPFVGQHEFAGEKRRAYGAYASINYAANALLLEASLRYDKLDSSYKALLANETDKYTTWNFGAGYQIDAHHRVTTSIGSAFKAPSFADLSSNLFLSPEKSINTELNASGSYRYFYWQVAAYHNKVDNLILYFNDNINGGYSDNVNASIKGIEFETAFSTGSLSHTLTLEYKRHEDTKGVQLARRAKENAKWLAEYSYQDIDLSLAYSYTGRRLDLPSLTPTNNDYLPSYSLFDFGATYWISSELLVRGRIDNLLNNKYETAKGYPASERTYYLSFDYKL